MFKNPSFIFDILCTVVWLVLAIRYARKGFLAGVVQLTGNLISLFGARQFSGWAAGQVFERFFAGSFRDQIAASISAEGAVSLSGIAARYAGFLPESFRASIVETCERSISAVLNDNAVLLADVIVQKVLAPLLTPVISLVLFFVAHAAIKYYLLHIYRNKRGTNQLFLVTTTDRVKDTLAEIENAKDWEHRLTGIAIIDDNQIGTWYEGIPVVATYDTMFQYAKEQIVDEVFLNVPYDTGESLAKVVEAFEDMGATVHITIELLKRFDDYHKNFNMMGNVPVVTFSNQYYDWKMLFVKRLMDIAGAIVGLAITAVVTVFLAPPLLIESPGPLFFAQKRVGKNGRFFKIYKFRSMYKDAEERKKELESQNEMNGFMFKMKDDPRITKVGKFIRKTSIDELPQFYNVLKGDMSLVGTRPPTVDEFRQYESHQKRRLSAKPGITGLWQVSGRNEIKDFEDVVKLDVQYIDNWSIGLDIKIILKTIKVVFEKGGE